MRRAIGWAWVLFAATACGDGPTIWNPGYRDLDNATDAVWDVLGDVPPGREVPGEVAAEAVEPDVLWPDEARPEIGGDLEDLAHLSDAGGDPRDEPEEDAFPEDRGAEDLPGESVGGDEGSGPDDLGETGHPGDPDAGPSDPGPVDPGGRDDGPLPVGLRIRFIAANLTSGSDQSWDPGHGLRILQGLRGDLLLVQEFNYGSNTAQDYQRFADQACGTGCSWSAGRGQIPNGVVSRWPIVASGAWDDPAIDNRDLDWARIDLPGPKDLVVVSVHLHTSPSSDQVRAAQVVARKVAEHRQAEPGCCWYVVGGDFNGTAAVSSSGFGSWQGEEVFYVRPPHPVGEDGSTDTNRNRSSQYDFVLLDTVLVRDQVPTCFAAVQGTGPDRCYAPGLVFDTRDFSQSTLDTYFPPTLTGDSGASNMQHMAVVKDVVLQ